MAYNDGQKFGRRGVLVAGVGLLGVLGGGLPALAASRSGVLASSLPGTGQRAQIVRHPAVRAGYQFLDAAMDAYPHYGAFRLLQSYADEAGLFSTAYVYDSALAVLAYLAEGSPASVERAQLLGESLRFAQEHDPGYRDGRLRQSYTVGPYVRNGVEQTNGFVDPDGVVNAGNAFDHSASYTGDQAWAGLALLALARRGMNPAFAKAAVKLGTWIDSTCGTAQPLSGYRAGVGATGSVLTRTDTTHNAALAVLFGQLAALTGDHAWIDRRAKAARFVHQMWQPDGGFYASGSDDGEVVAQFPVTTETQTTAVLALHGAPRPARTEALDWVTTELTVTDNGDRIHNAVPDGFTVSGVSFSDRSRLIDPDVPIEPGLQRPDPDAVWFEGVAQLAAALLARADTGDLEAANAQLNTLADVQRRLGQGQRIANKPLGQGFGIIAASSPLHTGITDFGYYPARHAGTTAWFLLAATGTNPFTIGDGSGWQIPDVV